MEGRHHVTFNVRVPSESPLIIYMLPPIELDLLYVKETKFEFFFFKKSNNSNNFSLYYFRSMTTKKNSALIKKNLSFKQVN